MRSPTRCLLLALALPVALAPLASASDWATRIGPAVAEARQAHKLLLVDLYASWCGWCKELDARVFSTPRFREYARTRFVLLRVDTEDGGEGSELDARFSPDGLPTTLILTPELALAGKVEGFLPADEYIARLDAELAEYRAYVQETERGSSSTDAETLRRLANQAHQRMDGERAAPLYRRLLANRGVPPTERPLLEYLLADALRLRRDFAGAAAALTEARRAAEQGGNTTLLERADLLAFSIFHESGDCHKAKASLERFLHDHPQSVMTGQAQRALQALAADKSAQCT